MNYQYKCSLRLKYSLSIPIILSAIALGLSGTMANAGEREIASLLPLPTVEATSESMELVGAKLLSQSSTPNSPKPASTIKKKPRPTQPTRENQTEQTPTQQETRVLVSEVLVKSSTGKLSSELEDQAYRAIRTKPGKTTTRSQLREDINAIFATGLFSNVRAVPEDTPLGVRVTFKVQPNPIFTKVQIEANPGTNVASVLKPEAADELFKEQYGKMLNLRDFQEGVKNLTKLYQDQGYVLAQVVGSPKVSKNGVVTLQVAEGVVENIRVRFRNREGEVTDDKGNPIKGRTPQFLIKRKIELKSGQVFNRNKIEKDLKRVFRLGLFADVNVSLDPGTDPSKVDVVINVVERNTISIGGGFEISTKTELSSKITVGNTLINAALETNDRDLIESLDRLNKLYYEAKKLDKSGQLESQLQAIAKYQEVISLAKTKKDVVTELFALVEIGNVYQSVNAIDQTIKLRQRALEFINKFTRELQENDDFGSEPNHLIFLKWALFGNLSSAYQSLGEYQLALIFAKRVQIVARGLKLDEDEDEDQQISSLISNFTVQWRGFLQYDLGEQEIGRQSLQSFINELLKQIDVEEVEDNKDILNLQTIAPIINIYFSNFASNQELSNKWIATTFNDFLPILKLLEKKVANQPQTKDYFHLVKAIFFQIVGNSYREAGDNETALSMLYKSLLAWQELEKSQSKSQTSPSKRPNNTDSLNSVLNLSNQAQIASSFKADIFKEIGVTLFKLDKKLEAIDSYQKALKIYQKLNDKYNQASILVEIGNVQRSLGQYQQAINNYNQALAIWRELKNVLAQANTRLEIAKAERDRNNLAESRTQIETAIELIETEPPPLDTPVKAASLSEQKQFKAYIDLASYFSAKQHFYDFYVDLLMLLHKQNPSQGYQVQALQASEQSRGRSLLAILKRRDRYVSTNTKNNIDGNKSQALATVPKLAEIQRQVLDDDSILLEYALGEERSYLWVVSKTSIKSYELPKRADIETAARKFYDFLTVPSLRVRSNKSAKAGKELSKILLGGAANQLGGKRLVIVGDGILQYIPFSILPHPDSSKGNSREPLITKYEIVNLPSASTFAVLKNSYHQSPSPSKTLAIFADPVFGYADDRWTRKSFQPKPTKKPRPLVGGYQSPAALLSEQIFPRLPSTQMEAMQISRFVPLAKQLQKTGFAASRKAALDSSLSQYKILHFSTHGTLDAQRPERSGMLLSVLDRQGNLERGLLSTPDVFNLQLSADLVVLSGCRTGLGKEIKGEGLIGLTGGLMYAGAKRVVVSLWSVDEEATAALMSYFYKGIFQDKLPPSQALRNAQLQIRQEPRWQNPYYWAGFTLQGDWR